VDSLLLFRSNSTDQATLSFAEAEDRLYIALPGLFFSVTGMLTFGFVAQNPSPNGWLGLEFGLGMIAFGLMQA